MLNVTAYTTNTTKKVERNSQMRVMPGSESVNEPMVMKAGEDAGRHNLKKPAPMIDPMSWAEMNARNSSTRAQGSAPNCVRGGVPFGVPNTQGGGPSIRYGMSAS